MITPRLVRKFTAILANLSLLLNTFLPFALVVQPVYAQSSEIVVSSIKYDTSANKLNITTNSSEKISYQLFYKSPEKIDAIAGNDLDQANQNSSFYLGTCSSNSVCLSQNISRGILKIESASKFYSKLFTLENNVLTVVKEIESSQSDLTQDEDNFLNNINPQVLGNTVSDWTFEKVELNKTYTAPQNDQVKITFTKLPTNPGNIKIEEITLTEDQINQTGSVSNKAYDITSDMADGTFAYNLSLPIPETLKNQTVEIKFAEEVSDLGSAQKVDVTTKTDDSVSAKNLNHFTVFIIVYNSAPAITPGSFPSLGFAATSTSEFGDHIILAGTERRVGKVTVGLTNWSCENDFTKSGDNWIKSRNNDETCITTPGSTFTHPITLNIYNVDKSTSVPKVGSLVTTKTINAVIPFRPSYDSSCPSPASDQPFGGTWRDPISGNCVHGFAFDINFDLGNITLPDEVIIAVAYNTYTHGYSPLTASGPYDSLNMSLDSGSPSFGTNVNSDDIFWNTSYAGFYTDGGASGANILRQDTGWTGYVPVIKVHAIDTSQPATPTVSFSAGGTTIPTNGYTQLYNFTFNLSSSATTEYFKIKYWNDISTSPFKQNSPWSPANLNSYSSSLGVYNDKLSQGEGRHFFSFAACNSVNTCSSYSSTYIVNYDKTAPNVPVHVSPSNNLSINYNDFWFNWDDVLDAVSYEIQNSTDPTLDSTGSFKNIMWTGDYQKIQPTTSIAHSVGANGTWYWQVRSVDAAGNKSSWTVPWKITIDKSVPVITINPYNTSLTNQNITVTASVNEGVLNTTSHTFTQNGSFTFTATDDANNVSSKTVTIDNIEKDSPDVFITSPTESVTNKNVEIKGTVLDQNPHHYYLVIKNSIGNIVAGPGTINNSAQFIDKLLFSWNISSFADGLYTINLEARDAANNKDSGSVATKTILIDKTPPSVPSLMTPSNGDIVKGNPVQTWSAVSGVHHYVYESYWDLAGNNKIYTENTLTNGRSVGGNQNITFYWRVKSVDSVGNESNWSEMKKLTIDNIAPNFSSKTIFSGWYNTDKLSSFEYSDSNIIDGYTNPVCTISTEGTNQFCTITPNVCDKAGNCNTTVVSSNTANIDKTKPESTINAPDNTGNNSTVYTNSWVGSITGTATDILSGLNAVKISIKNSQNKYFDGISFVDSIDEILLTTVLTDNNWSYSGLLNPEADTYTIKSHAIDNATNQEDTYTLTIILDKTIPQVSLTVDPINPDASNGWYKTQPTITLDATDDILIDKVEYKWGTDGSWVAYTNPFKPETEGARVLYYRSVDKAGNISSDNGIKNIKWDKTELELGPQNISANPNPTSGSTSKITWEKAKDNDGVDHYEIKWMLNDNSNNLSYSKTVDGNTFETEVDQLIEGRWTIRVIAFDASGKSKDNSIDLIVDRTGPSAPNLTLTGTGVGTASLSWNAINDAKDYIVWYGNTPGTYLYGARVGNVTSYTVRGLGAGNYYFIIKAVDAAQNQGSNSNEVNTGTIAGAAGTEPGQPAEGFTSEVLGANTESDITTPTPSPTGEVLGESTANGFNKWWLLLLLIPTYFVGRKLTKKKK